MAIIDPTHDFLAFLQGVALTLFYLAATSCVAVQSALLTNMVHLLSCFVRILTPSPTATDEGARVT